MADAHSRDHSYHLVDPSPWPIAGALGALLLTVGMVLWFHDVTVWVFIIGVVLIAYTMLVWWRDIIREGEHEGHHTPIVQLGLRYGMVLFIASEVMFFLAWFWAYYNAALFPTESMGGTWPPEGVYTFDVNGISRYPLFIYFFSRPYLSLFASLTIVLNLNILISFSVLIILLET